MMIKKALENKVVAVRACVAGVAFAVPAVVGTITSFALEPGIDPLTIACNSMASSISSAIGAVIPIALPIVGTSLVVVIGLKVFKRIVSKA